VREDQAMTRVATLAPVATRSRPGPDAGAFRDTAWFASLYEATIDEVFRYAFVFAGDANQAEDVVSEVFLKAWRARHTLRDETTSLSWLLTITHNCAMSMLRANPEVADLDALADPGATPGAELFRKFEVSRVHAAVRRLTPEQQQVVILRFFEGLTHDDVARRLARNANAVRAIQFRALGRLRKLLDSGESSG
jgi:RNA polymerase sigma-70 factor (ECF subfamily)